jgi:16S rRNA (guanine527-N7)-methyltransferase
MSTELIEKYFDLTPKQKEQFKQLYPLYQDWNSKINVISRKNIDQLYTNHVLHSLGIAKLINFLPNADVLDVGTGGGFPGIPLAILFPETNFHLVDSIGKKLKVVDDIADKLDLKNIKTTHDRVENINGKYDFIVSRAVTKMPDFVKWVKGKIKKESKHPIKNGILYLKGGDLTEELAPYQTVKVYDLKDFFEEPFFETKKLVYLPLKYQK